MGQYVLTVKDVMSSKKFPDSGIANGVHPIDLHIKDEELGGDHLIVMPCGDYYQIPYECLLPEGVDNLLIAGRSVSADFFAQGSLRVMATCMGIGQAAGTAAAMAISQNKSVGKINVTQLRSQLIEQGAYLGQEDNLPGWNLGREPLPLDIQKNAYPHHS